MSEVTTFQGITLLVAVVGVALSTYKIVTDHRKDKRHIKVNTTFGVLNQKGNAVSPNIIGISAVNTGFRDVTLNSVGFFLPNGKKTIIMEQNKTIKFPYTLEQGKECTVWKFRFRFAEELKKRNGFQGKVKVKGYYQSATGVYYNSKIYAFDTESKHNNINKL